MFCRNCGAAQTDDEDFCQNCGQPVNTPCDLPLKGQMNDTITPSAFPLEPDLIKLSKNKKMVLTIIPSFAAVLIIGAIIGTIFLLKGIDWKDSNFQEGTDIDATDAAAADGIISFDGNKEADFPEYGHGAYNRHILYVKNPIIFEQNKELICF